MLLEQISTEFVYQLFLVLCRISAAIMMMPALGEKYLVNRGKIILSIFIAILILPIVHSQLPEYPANNSLLLGYIMIETLIGIVLGFSVRIVMHSLSVVGNIISMQSGLSAANFFDPVDNIQTPIFANFLILFCVMMIFATDTHHLFLAGIIDSYNIFAPGQMQATGDISELIVRNLSYSFTLAFKFASPFIVVSMGTMLGSGILSRLMPNLQVFFVLTPAQILIAMFILSLVAVNIVSRLVEILGRVISFSNL